MERQLLLKDEIEQEAQRIKALLDIAYDDGVKYKYINLTSRRDGEQWQEQQINEILNGLIDCDAILLSHSVDTHTRGAGISMYQYTKISLLFEMIYN